MMSAKKLSNVFDDGLSKIFKPFHAFSPVTDDHRLSCFDQRGQVFVRVPARFEVVFLVEKDVQSCTYTYINVYVSLGDI